MIDRKPVTEQSIATNNVSAVTSWAEDRASKLLKAIPIFFYHSRDDEIVPFTHLALHAEKFPQATVREFDGRGHQFNNDLSEIAADIKSL